MGKAIKPKRKSVKQVWQCPKCGERQDLDIRVSGGMWHDVEHLGKTSRHRMKMVWEKGTT